MRGTVKLLLMLGNGFDIHTDSEEHPHCLEVSYHHSLLIICLSKWSSQLQTRDGRHRGNLLTSNVRPMVGCVAELLKKRLEV